MATLGSSPSWSNWEYYGSNTYSQACTGLYTMPGAGGIVTSVSFYADSNSGTTNFSGCVWNSSGGLIVASSEVGLGAGSESVGGQNWHTFGVAATWVAGGVQIRAGWWRTNTGSMLYSYGSGSGYVSTNNSSPGNLGSLTSIGGAIGAYINYNPVNAPTATTNAATGVSATTATLNGAVGDGGLSAAGGGSTSCDFNISTSPTGSPSTPVTATPSTFTGSANPTAAVTGLTPNTTYYYQVAAYGEQGTTYGAWVAFTTVGTPNAPSPTAPASGAAGNSMTGSVTFDWTYHSGGAAGGETGYALQLSLNGGAAQWWDAATQTLSGSVVWNSSASTTATIPAGILTPGTWTWEVASEDANGTGPYCAGQTWVSEGPPNAPTLDNPTNATYADASTFTPSWTYSPTNAVGGQTGWQLRIKVSGASSYSYLNAGTSSLQSSPVTNAGSINSYAFPSGLVVNGHVYDWSVATQDAGGLGPFASDFTFTAQAVPAVTVVDPTGSVKQTDPVVQWSATFPSGAGQTAYQIRTFSAAQYGAGGFNPASSAAFDDSGVVGGSATSYQMVSHLVPGTAYRAYANITETGGESNGFNAFSSFSASIDLPPAPTLTATATTDPITGCPMIQLAAACALNILSYADGSFETGVGSFVGANCTLAQSSTKALDGAYSLSLDCSGTSPSTATSGYYPVLPSTEYTALASLIAGSTARSCSVGLAWYTSADALIFTSTGTAANDATGAWTQVSATATSPANAAYVKVVVTVTSAASGEYHYLDQVGIFPGAGTTWSTGGLLGTGGVVLTRSDGLMVRFASTANPAAIGTSQVVTVNDYEAIPGVAYTYTAQVQGNPGTGQVTSNPSAAAGAALSTLGWWLMDPTNPSSAVTAAPLTVNVQQTEQSAAHYPVGQAGGVIFPVVVTSGFNGQDGSFSWKTFDPATFAAIQALLTLGKTVFISSPFGVGYYGRIGPMPGGMSSGMGSKVQDATLQQSVAVSPVQTLAMTFVGQPRPPV